MNKLVAILGAGPVGLAAAVHVLDRGMTPLIIERGKEVGHAVREWSHVRMFSTWQYNMDAATVQRLVNDGWVPNDPDQLPTGGELLDKYIEPLARTLTPWLKLGHTVLSVGREGIDKVKDAGRSEAAFVIETSSTSGLEFFRADAVIDVTGSWFQPNPGGPGRPVFGEVGHPNVHYATPDVAGRNRGRFIGKRVAVLGGGHSAAGSLIGLSSLAGTTVTWLCRATTIQRALGGGAADQLAARGALGTELAQLVSSKRVKVENGFHLMALEKSVSSVAVATDGRRVEFDELIISTGFRPDLSILRELRVALDPALECPIALASLIDPNLHSCGTVRPHGAEELSHPEKNFYIAGMKSYGRAPTFLLATGYEQVRSVVAAIAGDLEAAARVELCLPETGVCNSRPTKVASAA